MFRLSAAFAAVVGIVLAFIPLLAVHGVESALALGLLLPPWVAATAASYTERHRGLRGIDLIFRSVGMGLLSLVDPVRAARGQLAANAAVRARRGSRLRGARPGARLHARGLYWRMGRRGNQAAAPGPMARGRRASRLRDAWALGILLDANGLRVRRVRGLLPGCDLRRPRPDPNPLPHLPSHDARRRSLARRAV